MAVEVINLPEVCINLYQELFDMDYDQACLEVASSVCISETYAKLVCIQSTIRVQFTLIELGV